jgi:glycosyltransferase involved in cell wall biosynthesis
VKTSQRAAAALDLPGTVCASEFNSLAGRRGAPRRQWAINGDFLTLKRNGVSRYAREVTRALDTLIAEGHPLTLDLDLRLVTPCESDEKFECIPTTIVREFTYPRLPQFWVQAQLPFFVKGGLLSFCNLAPIACSRHIACIHDLHTRFMPESYSASFRLAHRIILPLVGRRAARITTVSGLSKEHLAKFGIAPRDKIVAAYNGADHAKRWDKLRSLLSTENQRPFALCFGRPEKYKNTEILVRLAPLLDEVGIDLWVAGDSGAAAFDDEKNVRILGRISDDDLAKALSEAVCFLFPSRIEGFGLPAVEAMAHGCPVVASTAPCLPEICADAALYAEPDDLSAWLDAVVRLRSNTALRGKLVQQGFARAERFSWRAVAHRYLTLMAEVDAGA